MRYRWLIKITAICSCLAGVTAMGCSGYTPTTKLVEESSSGIVYQVSEQEALDLVYGAMHEVLPEQKIYQPAKPRVGLFVHEQLRPGDVRYARFKETTYIYEVDILRVEGTDSRGNTISGYTYAIKGNGDLKAGPGNLAKIDQKIKSTFDQTDRGIMATAVSVQEAAPPAISSPPPAPAPKASAVEQPKAPSENDAFEKLEKLKKLLDQGIITQEEFDAKKRELLDRI